MKIRIDFCVLALVVSTSAGIAVAAQGESYCNRPADFRQLKRDRGAKLEALKSGKVDQLEGFYGGLVKAYEKGVASSSEMDGWFGTFEVVDLGAEPHIQSWLKKYPQSYAAHLAYARYLQTRAFQKRGTNFASQTSEEQMRGMAADMKLMLTVLDDAEPLSSKPVLSNALRITAGRALGWPREQIDRDLRAAEKLDPTNSYARTQYLWALMVKWGGLEGELDRYLSDIQKSGLPQDIKDVITWRGLVLQAEELKTYATEDPAMEERVAQLYERADALCSAFTWGGSDIVSYYVGKKDYKAALRYLDRFEAKQPENSWHMQKRANVFFKMGLVQESFSEYKRAAEMGDPAGMSSLAWYYETGTVVPKDLRRALQLYEASAARGYANGRDGSERVRKRIGPG